MMIEKQKEICCSYNSLLNMFMVFLTLSFSCFLIYCIITLFEYSMSMYLIILFTVGALVVTLYYFLEMINKKVILTDKTIEIYDIFGHKRLYNLSEITKVIFFNSYRQNYTVIMINNYKIKIRMHVKRYDEFTYNLAKFLNLDGYGKRGRVEFELEK